MCKIEGVCLECENAENCPMLLAHREFEGTLRSVMCIEFKPTIQTIENRLPIPTSVL